MDSNNLDAIVHEIKATKMFLHKEDMERLKCLDKYGTQ